MHIEERTLDVSKKDGRSGQIKPVILRKGEQNQTQIKINLTSDGEPYSIGNLTPRFCAILPDKKYVRDASHVTKSTNYVTYTVQSDLTSADGDIRVAYVELQSSGNSLTSDTLPIIVLENTDLTTEQAQQYQDQIEALVKDLENSINKANNAASNASSAATSANNAASSANTAKTNAQNAANSANTAANEANTAKNNADKATSAANTAAEAANTAKQAVDDAMGKFTTITDSEVKYQVGTSGTTPPTGTWLTEPPTVPQGQYLWVRNTTSYNKGNPTVAYAVAFQGRDGSFAGDERIEALEEAVENINDITTMPNLLVGTRDFIAGTGAKTTNYYTNGFDLGVFTTNTKDSDGFTIASFQQFGLSSDSTKSIFCPVIKHEPNTPYTLFADCMIDDLSNFTKSFILVGRIVDSSGTVTETPITVLSDEITEPGRWVTIVKHFTSSADASHYIQFYGRLQRNGSIHFRKFGIYKGYIERPEWFPSLLDKVRIEQGGTGWEHGLNSGVNLVPGTSNEWSDWVTPEVNKTNSAIYPMFFTSGNLVRKLGDVYTNYIEVEFENVTATPGQNFIFRPSNACTLTGVSGWQYNSSNPWGFEILLNEPPVNKVYKFVFHSTMTSTDYVAENLNQWILGFRCDYWASGRYRYRCVKMERGHVDYPQWTPGPEDLAKINDITTGINLIKGTRDFLRGTAQKKHSAYSDDGFYLPSSGFYSIKDSDNGTKILNIHQSGVSTNTYRQCVSSVFYGLKPGDVYTASFDFMVDDVNEWDVKSVGAVRQTTLTNSIVVNVDFAKNIFNMETGESVSAANLESKKWYKIIAPITCQGDSNTEYAGYIFFTLDRNGSINYKNVCVYEGNINNPVWSANPFDVAQESELTTVKADTSLSSKITMLSDFTYMYGRIDVIAQRVASFYLFVKSTKEFKAGQLIQIATLDDSLLPVSNAAITAYPYGYGWIGNNQKRLAIVSTIDIPTGAELYICGTYILYQLPPTSTLELPGGQVSVPIQGASTMLPDGMEVESNSPTD